MERHIEVTHPVRASVRAAGRVLADDAMAVFAPLARAADRRGRELVVDLRAHGSGATTVGHAVDLTLTAPRRTPCGGAVLGVRWEPTSHVRLLPTFDGKLEVVGDGHGSALSLRGRYRPPLGPLGRLVDRVVGHRLARRTADDLVAALSGHLEAAVRRAAPDTPPAGPYAPDLREPTNEDASERWLG